MRPLISHRRLFEAVPGVVSVGPASGRFRPDPSAPGPLPRWAGGLAIHCLYCVDVRFGEPKFGAYAVMIRPRFLFQMPVGGASADAAHPCNILEGPQQQVLRVLSPPVIVLDRLWLVFLWGRIRLITHATDGIQTGRGLNT